MRKRLSLFSILFDDFLKFSEIRDKESKLGPMYFNFIVPETISPAAYRLSEHYISDHETEAAIHALHRFLLTLS